MLKIMVFKIENNENTNTGYFQTQEQALEWLTEGNRQRWWQTEDKIEIIPAKKELRQNPDNPEEMIEVEIEPEQQIVHPATHRYEIIDMTEEIQKEQALQKRARLRQAGERLIDEISEINSSLNVPFEQIVQIMTDPDLILIRELLWAGSLQSAKAAILQNQNKILQFWSQNIIDGIISKIDQAISEIES